MSSRPTDIDRLYGLEPVIEPGDGSDGLAPFADIQCPYCGEMLTLPLDLSAGSQSYVEDCHVCCQPMQVSVRTAPDATLEGVSAERMDR
jgi:hypothetical protein